MQAQADQTETQIKEEFEKLHRFLRGEEEVRIAALRKEERDKTADLEEKIEAIERVMSSLSERMRPIQELMETDEVSFIQVGMSCFFMKLPPSFFNMMYWKSKTEMTVIFFAFCPSADIFRNKRKV